jgi:hypothetical protein
MLRTVQNFISLAANRVTCLLDIQYNDYSYSYSYSGFGHNYCSAPKPEPMHRMIFKYELESECSFGPGARIYRNSLCLASTHIRRDGDNAVCGGGGFA